MQVQPQCQTKAGEATLFATPEIEVLWSGGSGPALGKSAGDPEGETPSDLGQVERMLLQHTTEYRMWSF